MNYLATDSKFRARSLQTFVILSPQKLTVEEFIHTETAEKYLIAPRKGTWGGHFSRLELFN
ncbi:hypothetical protein SADUNF_Sadunf04G0112200 [Salix dunnii]|uniref:Uncharacterized protein n=1 Tax=Salix dunnii TaxID=1413687 RepID=A0A835N0Y6_9ROSI|nr:hypothetical protein SADUNF_Sadunf04G0112200 [Salix dunnii]